MKVWSYFPTFLHKRWNSAWHLLSTMCLLNKMLNCSLPCSLHSTVHIKGLSMSAPRELPHSSFLELHSTPLDVCAVEFSLGPLDLRLFQFFLCSRPIQVCLLTLNSCR